MRSGVTMNAASITRNTFVMSESEEDRRVLFYRGSIVGDTIYERPVYAATFINVFPLTALRRAGRQVDRRPRPCDTVTNTSLRGDLRDGDA